MCGLAIFLLLLLLRPALVLGFGATGHQVTALIAEQYLTPSARAAVLELLDGESLAEASTWADEMRSGGENPSFWGYDHAANWHFLNVEPGQSYREARKNPRGDAYVALEAFIALLQSGSLPAGPIRDGLTAYFGDLEREALQRPLKQFALRFLVHLAGDLHQPLHTGYRADLGGNRIAVRWFGGRTNLHSVWDTRLVEYPGSDASELAAGIKVLLGAMDDGEITEIQREPPQAWVAEAIAMLPVVYAVEDYGEDLRDEYAAAYFPVAERQLLKAGLRMAHLLNAIFQ